MIGILCLIDLEYIPYLKKYTDFMDKKKIDYEVIFWQRENNKKYDYKSIIFKLETDLSTPKHKKIYSFVKYRKFVLKTLKDKKYSKVIVLSTLMGILIYPDLIKNYKNKMIFDIRDFTYENFNLFKKLELKIIQNSYSTVISSKGFYNFLPFSEKYTICHNILPDEIKHESKFVKKENNKITITFIGAIRHFKTDVKVIEEFAKDKRFKIVFHGFGSSYYDLKKYSKDLDVILTGKYDRKDKAKLLEDTDIINSYYDDNDIVNKFAISNKYYDAIIYKKPLWANPNTYMGKLAISQGIGLNCSIDADAMYNEYIELDKKKFEKKCELILTEILEDEKIFYKMLNSFIES